MSSGAASFKKNRGGFPVVEYNAVYSKHLSYFRRMGWKVLKILVDKIAVPLLNKYEL